MNHCSALCAFVIDITQCAAPGLKRLHFADLAISTKPYLTTSDDVGEKQPFENITTVSHKPEANDPTRGFSSASIQRIRNGNLQGAVAML